MRRTEKGCRAAGSGWLLLLGLIFAAGGAYGDVGFAGLRADNWLEYGLGVALAAVLTIWLLSVLLVLLAIALDLAGDLLCRMRPLRRRRKNVPAVIVLLAGLAFCLCSQTAKAQQNFSFTPGTNSAVVLAKRNLTVGQVPAWTKSTAYAAGDYFMTAAQQFYLVRTAGTSGTNAPTAESTAVTNGTLVAEFVPLGPRTGFVIVNAGTNIVDLTIGDGVGGTRLWPRGSWCEAGLACPQAELRAVTDGGAGAVSGCWW